jgi:hypothetical protein
MKIILPFVIVVLLLFYYSKADDGFYRGEGATVVPMNNDQIELLEESIHINYITEGYNTYWVANCSFVFYNSGPKCRIQMGFPDSPDVESGYGERGIRNFKSFIDGNEIQTKYKELDTASTDSLFSYNRTRYAGVFTW